MYLRVEDLGAQEELCMVKFNPQERTGVMGGEERLCWDRSSNLILAAMVRHRVTSSSQHSRDLPNCTPASPSPGRVRMDGDQNGDPKLGDRKGEEGIP